MQLYTPQFALALHIPTVSDTFRSPLVPGQFDPERSTLIADVIIFLTR